MNTKDITAGTAIKVRRAGSSIYRVYEVLSIENRDGFAFLDVPASKKAYASDGQIKTVIVIDGVDSIEMAA